ncbi:MAG: hypothetical protein LBS90_02250 [Oscillospiraceae bacterium]|jgi:hypothetical protein|nr:hypothetical protein [Oscillospiraceae bacterium]
MSIENCKNIAKYLKNRRAVRGRANPQFVLAIRRGLWYNVTNMYVGKL